MSNTTNKDTSLVIAGHSYAADAVVDLTETGAPIASLEDLTAAIAGINSFVPLEKQPDELTMNLPVRATLNVSRFTAHSDWLGTRVVSSEPNWSDPLFAESLAKRYSPKDFLEAAKWLMNKGRSHELAKMFGIPAHTRIAPRSIAPSAIYNRFSGGSEFPSMSVASLCSELLVAIYKYWDVTSPSTRRAALSQPQTMIPNREHLKKRAHVHRILAAMKEIKLPSITHNDERVAGNLDGHVASTAEALLEALYRASHSENYVDLALEALRARLLRETMPHLPAFILDDPELADLSQDATLVMAALASSSSEFRVNFEPLDKTMGSTEASAHYAAYAAFLPTALQFVKNWLMTDPGLTTLPLEAALQSTEVQRVVDVSTQAIRGGVIRTVLRETDQSASLGIISRDTEYGLFIGSSAQSSLMGQAAIIQALDPDISERHNAQLASVLAAILHESSRSMVSTVTPDARLLQLAAMALAEETFIQANVSATAMNDPITRDLDSSYTLVYRHRIDGALGFMADLQNSILASAKAGEGREGLPGLEVIIRSKRDGSAEGTTPDGAIELEPVDVDGSDPLSMMTLRVGSSPFVYSVDPRIVLLAGGDRSAVKPWEVGVHRLDYKALNRVYVRGLGVHEANLARPIIYSQEEVGRYKKLTIRFQISKLANMLESERAYVQPLARVNSAVYITLLKQVVNATSESRGNPLNLPADLRRRFRSMVASRLLWQIEQYYGVGQQSRIVAIIRSFAFSLQRAGVLSTALNRFPEDDRRLVLFLLQAIFTSSTLLLSGTDLNDEKEVLDLMKEVITSDEFRDHFFVSPLAASIQL